MTGSPTALHDQAFMDALLELVIPPNAAAGIPGAGALALSPAVVAGLEADSLLGPMVGAALQALRDAALSQHPEGLAGMTPEARAKFAGSQFSANPFAMMGLLRYLYPAYYQLPQVLAAIGEPPRPPFPEGFEVEPTDSALFEKLQARRR